MALLFTQYTPYRLPNGQKVEITDEYKERHYRNVINSIEAYAPGFEKLIVGRDMLFPTDLEEQFSLTGIALLLTISTRLSLHRWQYLPRRATARPTLLLPAGDVLLQPSHSPARSLPVRQFNASRR